MEVKSEIIRQYRQTRGWTQQHLADAAGLSLRTVQRAEREGNAAKESAMAICAVFMIDMRELSVIPQASPAQLQTVRIRGQLLTLASALVVGALSGALITYLAIG